MTKNRADRVTGSRTTDSNDIHDIRALTATGAITLPARRPHPKADDDEVADRE